ncbi:MAG: OmpA family protein [Nevskiales bacterium]
MNTANHLQRVLLLALTLGIAPLAVAQEEEAADSGGDDAAAASGEIDDRTYIGVLGGLTEPDSDRPQDYDDAYTLSIIVGSQKSEKLNTEWNLSYSTFEYSIGVIEFAHDFQVNIGYDILYFLNRDGWAPFGLAGVALTHDARQTSDSQHASVNVGAGVIKPFNDHGAAFRAEARYLYHFDDKDGNDDPADIRLVAGITVPLTAKPVPLPPPPPPPTAVDSDGDGVVDEKDKCPGTLAGVKVDGDGCAVPQVLKLNGVSFDFDSVRVGKNARTILDEVSEGIKGQPSMQVEIAGHTDNYGDETYNQQLSERRAKAVRDYLVEKGAPDANFTSKGYGEAEPVVANDTEDGREENRRVEFRILSQ